MAPVKCTDAPRASSAPPARPDHDDIFAVDDFDAELKRLAAANQELMHEFHHDDLETGSAVASAMGLAPADAEQLEMFRLENAELRARVEQLEALGAGKEEELWLERQKEFEALLEEKTEVIRSLHQKIQEAQESAIGGDAAPPPNPTASGIRLGQAEEILRLKRELEEQRKQLEQDEETMMAQMRVMELAMAKERAEMARQRQEVQRLQSDLAREIEQSSRDPQLKERLNNLRRTQDPKTAPATAKPAAKADQQKSSGFFRRIFG